MEPPQVLKEFHRVFMKESTEGIWRAHLEIPLPTSTSIEQQMEHLFQYAYLADCNDAFARMYGYESSRQIVGARFPDLFDRNDGNNIRNLQLFLTHNYRVRDGETLEKHKDGSVRYFLNNAVGIVEDGSLIRVWGVQRDITDHKRREREKRDFYENLSPRQRIIFRMIAEGKSTKEIAAKLKISLKTVETHRSRLMKRLGIGDIPTLVRHAVRIGLVSDTP